MTFCLEGRYSTNWANDAYVIGPQRVELCVSAYKTDAQQPSSTSPMFHSTQNLYRTSYSAGLFSLMKLSGYCELPLIDLLWDTGFIILWAAVLLDEFKTFIASKWCRFCHKRTARVRRLLRLLYTWYNNLSLCFPCLSNPAQVRNNQYGTHELIPKKCQNPYVFILTSFVPA